MAQQTVPLYTVTSGDRLDQARTSLAEALEGAQLGEPDDAGSFDVSLDAGSPEEARKLVGEALARAGTGDDFVIRESTEGREIPADDPRQGGAARDRAAAVADAASAVAAAASAARSGDTEAAKESITAAADAAREAAADAASAARGAAADAAPAAAQESPWRQLVPIAGLLLLLALVRRRRRR